MAITVSAIVSYAPAANAIVLTPDSELRLVNSALFLRADLSADASPQEVLQAYQSGQLPRNTNNYVSFGFIENTVWAVLPVVNNEPRLQTGFIRIDNAWLDEVDIHFFNANNLAKTAVLGDLNVFTMRETDARMPAVEFEFPSGTTEVVFRFRSQDPMTIPVYLGSEKAQATYVAENAYFYGALYGSMLILLVYNLVLYFYLKEIRYLFYSLYLAAFTAFNFTYTGHGFWLLWSECVFLQQWLMPTLMFAYIFSGVVFTIEFLNARVFLPALYCWRFKIYGCLMTLAIIILVSQNRSFAVMIQLMILTSMALWMLSIGYIAHQNGNPFARFFVPAIAMGTGGAMVSSLATWGFIPYSQWAFRGIEIGILMEMLLLSVSLGFSYRMTLDARLRAETDARIDPLTKLYNRRAFVDLVCPIWELSSRTQQTASMLLMDLDWFKKINDEHGHTIGDQVLEQVSVKLKQHLRKSDIPLRWGGEEFLVFLPNTDADNAQKLAEKLRQSIASMKLPNIARLTVSIGVASVKAESTFPEQLVKRADDALYLAKQAGRNRVMSTAPSHEDKIISAAPTR